VYFNFTAKNNSQNRKNLQCWWDESGEYGSTLDLSKNKFLIGRNGLSVLYNSRKLRLILKKWLAEGRWKRIVISVLYNSRKLRLSLKFSPNFLHFLNTNERKKKSWDRVSNLVQASKTKKWANLINFLSFSFTKIKKSAIFICQHL
jgi:hypothetical protein